MSKGGYKIIDQGGLYYVSFVPMAIGMAWVDVFTRKDYRDIMSNHAHLIISANENNVSDVLGDF